MAQATEPKRKLKPEVPVAHRTTLDRLIARTTIRIDVAKCILALAAVVGASKVPDVVSAILRVFRV